MYNIMTCSGDWAGGLMGGCSQAWLVLAFIFLLNLILRRQTDDGVLSGTPFNFIGSMVVSMILAIALITLFGAAKWAFLGGIAGMLIGGLALGYFGLGGDGPSE